MKGIEYYYSIEHKLNSKGSDAYEQMTHQLNEFKNMLDSFSFDDMLFGDSRDGLKNTFTKISTINI